MLRPRLFYTWDYASIFKLLYKGWYLGTVIIKDVPDHVAAVGNRANITKRIRS